MLSILWILGYTLPRFDELIQVNPEVTMQSVAGMYALLVISSATHAWNYYELIGRTGNVSELTKGLFPYNPPLTLSTFAGCNGYFARTTSYTGVCIESFLVLQHRCSSMLYSVEGMG